MPRPFRECVAYYIGGGWGKEVEDAQHTAIARVIRGTDIPGARLNQTDAFPVRFHKLSNASSRLLSEGDIVFEVSGGSRDQPVGRSVFVTNVLSEVPTIPASFCKLIRLRKDICDPKFIYYVLTSDYLSRNLAQWQTQSTGIINYSFEAFLNEYEIDLPLLSAQRKIASILSAYDDLIENNTRRVRALEEMARALYREWFVEYRFPGHEQAEFIEDEQGRRPVGWERVVVGDYALTQYGLTASSMESLTGTRFLRGMDFNKRSFIDWSEVPASDFTGDDHKYKLKRGDLLLIRMADPGKAGLVEEDVNAVFASYIVRVKLDPKKFTTYYGFYLFLSDEYKGYIDGGSTGTTRKSASAAVLTGIKVFLPPLALQHDFDKFVTSWRESITSLVKRNANLRRTRDLLLPRLVSGELDVSELEIAGVEEEAVA